MATWLNVLPHSAADVPDGRRAYWPPPPAADASCAPPAGGMCGRPADTAEACEGRGPSVERISRRYSTAWRALPDAGGTPGGGGCCGWPADCPLRDCPMPDCPLPDCPLPDCRRPDCDCPRPECPRPDCDCLRPDCPRPDCDCLRSDCPQVPCQGVIRVLEGVCVWWGGGGKYHTMSYITRSNYVLGGAAASSRVFRSMRIARHNPHPVVLAVAKLARQVCLSRLRLDRL